MTRQTKSLDKLIENLEERAKELNCLYAIEETLQNTKISVDLIFKKIIKIIPTGMQYPEHSKVKIVYQDFIFTSVKFKESSWFISEDITVQDRVIGWIKVYYTKEKPAADDGPFLKEEKRVLNSIAKRIGHFVMFQRLRLVYDKMESSRQVISQPASGDWRAALNLMGRSDPDVLNRISRKMLNHLVWKGYAEAEQLQQDFMPLLRYGRQDIMGETNSPLQNRAAENSDKMIEKVFEIASEHISDEDIFSLIQTWVKQDKTSFLVRIVSSINSSLTDIADALRRYYKIAPDGLELAPSARIGVRAALIRRFFTDQLEFVNIAKNFVKISDFHELAKYVISPPGSHGKLGGKSAGLFLAQRILEENQAYQQDSTNKIKVPKTWYLTSDTMLTFMHYNNLEEMLEQKYKALDEIRREYPHVVMLFKNSSFPPDIVQGLSMALDDFGDKPLIVRSSSLLEDRLGSAFSGKYKSLFLVNQGAKNERLEALLDAIAEVYASTLGPDPMQYRAERGLIDFHEEMGIMIQEVVGKRVGNYFLPSYAGVAFSNNEFRWSPRIKREDGLIRLVPGLGTRAVDRLSDDYPVLIAPGQPDMRANVSIQDRVRYCPQQIDVLDLVTNSFKTIEVSTLLREHGDEYPAVTKMISLYEHNHLKQPFGLSIDFANEDPIVTFEGLISDSRFVKQIYNILRTLQNALATPIDIEFASDGDEFYLLQSRPQSYSKYDAPSAIPKEIPPEDTIFTANRYISNGTVPDISYIVYVDPDQYSQLSDLDDLKKIGRIIGKLNQALPQRQFILIGPGRWGSRGDIKLGVNVTYSDINNTAVLIEIARQKGNYVPDLSFGTHFFQDLVEANIRYLPLYPDDKGVIFNETFLKESNNLLTELFPAFASMSNVVRIIDVEAVTGGKVLRILMNADLEKAVGLLSPKSEAAAMQDVVTSHLGFRKTDHWRWRKNMAEKIAAQLDRERFSVKSMYLVGSTLEATAQPGSDIDLLVCFHGSEDLRNQLLNWFEGWSLCLDEMNFLRTGYKAGGLLDVHFVSEEEITDPQAIESRLKIKINDMKKLPLGGKQKSKKEKSIIHQRYQE